MNQATTTRQYVVAQFNPRDRRTYTYHNEGEPVAIDDKIIVSTNRGPATVTVVGLSSQKPSFETKPIIGKAPKED